MELERVLACGNVAFRVAGEVVLPAFIASPRGDAVIRLRIMQCLLLLFQLGRQCLPLSDVNKFAILDKAFCQDEARMKPGEKRRVRLLFIMWR